MVKINVPGWPTVLVASLVAVIAFALSDNAYADVRASVDRDTIELNESFMLEIVVSSNSSAEPDVSVLERDFYVGKSSQLTNTMIVQGQIARSLTWTYVLMAKRTGEQVIPAIPVGSEQSNPIRIRVSEPSNAPPGEADVFITSEVDQQQAYVQAQILYRIKVYRAVPTRQPALREPRYEGAEVLIEMAGDERSYDAILGGRSYNVVERVYAIFPQESGQIRISPARFEARVLRDGRITGRKVFESDAQSISVLPIPATPPDHPNAAWLPAHDLELSEDWSRNPDELSAGEPITRKISITALGQLETQIPSIEPPVGAGVNVYPDKPDLSRKHEAGGIRGVRRDQYAMIGVDPGVIHLPSLEVPWWDIGTGEWRIARLPERMINILPSGDPPLPETGEIGADGAVEPGGDSEGVSGAAEIITVQSRFWRRISELLAALWLSTVVAWWWFSRPPKQVREPAPQPLHKRLARHLKTARKAAIAGDAAGVRRAMLDWGRLQWPDDPPGCIGTIAQRVSTPLKEQLSGLSRVSYGPEGGDWDGEALARSLRSFAVIDQAKKMADDDVLPPLMPPA